MSWGFSSISRRCTTSMRCFTHGTHFTREHTSTMLSKVLNSCKLTKIIMSSNIAMAASYTKLAQNSIVLWFLCWLLSTRITDALVAANDHLKFHGKKMSDTIEDMDAYIQLTDEVLQQILQSTGSEMEKVTKYCLHTIAYTLMRFILSI